MQIWRACPGPPIFSNMDIVRRNVSIIQSPRDTSEYGHCWTVPANIKMDADWQPFGACILIGGSIS
jgi:hypothetical protein